MRLAKEKKLTQQEAYQHLVWRLHHQADIAECLFQMKEWSDLTGIDPKTVRVKVHKVYKVKKAKPHS